MAGRSSWTVCRGSGLLAQGGQWRARLVPHPPLGRQPCEAPGGALVPSSGSLLPSGIPSYALGGPIAVIVTTVESLPPLGGRDDGGERKWRPMLKVSRIMGCATAASGTTWGTNGGWRRRGHPGAAGPPMGGSLPGVGFCGEVATGGGPPPPPPPGHVNMAAGGPQSRHRRASDDAT